jgi:hypothetical protein
MLRSSGKENIAKLFDRFIAIWGDKWSRTISSYGIHTLSKEWIGELNEYTWEILEVACEKARSRFDWPPSIKEFKDLCIELVKTGVEKDDRAKYEFRRLQQQVDALKKKIHAHVLKLHFADDTDKSMMAIINRNIQAATKARELIDNNESIKNLERIIDDLEYKLGISDKQDLRKTLNLQGMWIYGTH